MNNNCCQILINSMKTIYKYTIIIRNSSSQLLGQSIVGRDFLKIPDFTPNELKSILWTALDLKNRFKNWSTQDVLNLKGVMITSLLYEPCIKNQVNIIKASQLIGAKVCTVVDKNWECAPSLIDTGRVLSNLSNVIVASAACSEQSLCDLATGATVPVINLGTPNSRPLTALGYALTILSYLGRLERLHVAWVGPSQSPILGSLLLLLPKFRVHLYVATENCKSPFFLGEALKLASAYKSEVHHVEKPEKAIYKADAIITTAHSFCDLQITRKHVEDAAVNWIFLHDLPRTPTEVTNDVFYKRKNSLVWESAENQFWVLLAVILRTLCEYEPQTPAPSFTED